MKTVTAADANRQFSTVLQRVSRGEVFTVVSRGKPVATIAPVGSRRKQQESARFRLVERLRQQKASGERRWSRNELYEP